MNDDNTDVGSVSVRRGRGRPTKKEAPVNVVVETLTPSASLAAAVPEEDGEAATPTTPKKKVVRRGRKAKVVGAYDALGACNNIPSPDENVENENVIVRLVVSANTNMIAAVASNASSTVLGNVSGNVPGSVPNAYNTHPNEYSAFQSLPMEFGATSGQRIHNCSNRDDVPSAASADDPEKPKIVELLKDFEMKSKNQEWPTSTSISCYWCCNQFNTVPFGIPVKYVDHKFHVYGCFCSLECAAAFNFQSLDSHDEKWERYHMINLLSHKIGHVDRVRAAPSRLALKMFGGYMEIDEFRSFATTATKVIGVNFPPMMTLTQQIEEMNECDVNSEYKYIPLDIERINKYREKIVLRRSKPVTEFKNTLDSLMNLKIHS